MIKKVDLIQHNIEIHKNLESWNKKPILKRIYFDFYKQIADYLFNASSLHIIEIGSGIGNIKDVIPQCIRTDVFSNPWIDQVENGYDLSFKDNSISNIIIFDIFHHLKYPETAFNEFNRVLVPNGRIILFEPCMSLLGVIVFGLLHHEPLGLSEKIELLAPNNWDPNDHDYYAAQGNASRIFLGHKYPTILSDWNVLKVAKTSAISYILSGGYSKPQFYPDKALPMIKAIDKLCDLCPLIFATRLFVVLEKKCK